MGYRIRIQDAGYWISDKEEEVGGLGGRHIK
jgi:hypothetical protein